MNKNDKTNEKNNQSGLFKCQLCTKEAIRPMSDKGKQLHLEPKRV